MLSTRDPWVLVKSCTYLTISNNYLRALDANPMYRLYHGNFGFFIDKVSFLGKNVTVNTQGAIEWWNESRESCGEVELSLCVVMCICCVYRIDKVLMCIS